jgi:predicted NAD/FAD-binding protein
MATHPDQAIKLIKNLDKKTQNLLENFQISKKRSLSSFRLIFNAKK